MSKSVDSNFRTFWLAPVTWNILGYSLLCERREKWRVILQKFQKKKLKKRFFIHLSDLVNTKITIPLRAGEERWIYTSMLCVSVYIHHYSPPLRGIVVYNYSFRSLQQTQEPKTDATHLPVNWWKERMCFDVLNAILTKT